ncbi:MAG: hypothetical protein OEV08_00390 [Nitrospira sp.]|nr:hypothetical protein [Nitrospira sp.]
MMWNVKRCIASGLVGGVLGVLPVFSAVEAGPPAAYTQEHVITIDATTITPQTWWHVPGVTPSIQDSDPESMDAYKTTKPRALKLKPGKYKFISFTFDFPFTVNLEGKLEFAKSLDQCVEGRGTQTLMIRCSRTYPYGGQRDNYYP